MRPARISSDRRKQVRARESTGARLGESTRALPTRLSNEALAPAALRADVSLSRPDESTPGFTFLLPDPPQNAHRFELSFEPGASLAEF